MSPVSGRARAAGGDMRLVDGEVVGTWRRADAAVTLACWRRLSRAQRGAVEKEAAALPLPGIRGPLAVRWDG